MSDFERTLTRLEEEVDEGLFTRGAQVCVVADGEQVLDVALGDSGTGQPMTSTTVFRVYCTIKPFLAVAVARAVDDGLVDLDERLDQRFPGVLGLAGGVTPTHVLTHTAGLHRPMGMEMELVAPARRRSVVEARSRPPGWRIGADAAYSEYVGWHVLGWLLEEVSGESLRPYLRRTLLDPLGLDDTWIGMAPEEYRAVLPRLGVSHDLRDLQGFPLLAERGERMCTEVNPAHGGYTTARDLAHFYARLCERLGGGGLDALPSPVTLRRFCSTVRPPTYDQVLDRVCPYGLGFMTSLADHAFGDVCSPSSFGHSGNVGSSFAFADPDHALAVAVVFNGIVDHESAFVRRPALMRALYADLGAVGEQDEEPVEAEEVRPGLFSRLRRGGRQPLQ